MKKEADIMMERGEWIDKVSNEIQKRTFEMLEKKVEQNQWEYWENQFIPIQQNSIESMFQEVFEENDQKDLAEKFPNIFNEIWKKVFKGLKEELVRYGYKIGYTRRKDNFGIAEMSSNLIEIELGEKEGLFQKIKKFFAQDEGITESSSDFLEEPKKEDSMMIEEKEDDESEEEKDIEDAEEIEESEEYEEIEEEMEED